MSFRFVSCAAALALGLGVVSTGATAQEAEAATEQEAENTATVDVPAPVKPKKITDRSHPDYVRCRTERVMGSLAQRRKICMTNREWAAVANEGNKRTNELVDEMRSTSVANN